MSAALLSARATAAIREGFDTLAAIIAEVLPDTGGRANVLSLLRVAAEEADSLARAIKNHPNDRPEAV